MRSKKRKFELNANKSNLMKSIRMIGGKKLNIILSEELLEKNECFAYFGSFIAVGRELDGEVQCRIVVVRRVYLIIRSV